MPPLTELREVPFNKPIYQVHEVTPDEYDLKTRGVTKITPIFDWVEYPDSDSFENYGANPCLALLVATANNTIISGHFSDFVGPENLLAVETGLVSRIELFSQHRSSFFMFKRIFGLEQAIPNSTSVYLFGQNLGYDPENQYVAFGEQQEDALQERIKIILVLEALGVSNEHIFDYRSPHPNTEREADDIFYSSTDKRVYHTRRKLIE